MDALYPAERTAARRVPRPPAPCRRSPTPAAARAWLDAERAILVARRRARRRPRLARPRHRLAATLFRYLDTGGHYPDAVAIHGHARAAARRAGDRAAEAAALTSLGVSSRRQGRYEQAAGHCGQALALFRAAGDGPARPGRWQPGRHRQWRGRYQQAAGPPPAGAGPVPRAGDRAGKARAVATSAASSSGRAATAGRRPSAAALALYRQAGDIAGEARGADQPRRRASGGWAATSRPPGTTSRPWPCTGRPATGRARPTPSATSAASYLRQGRYDDAARHLRQALALCRQTGDRPTEAYALSYLGDVCLRQGRPDQAARHQQQALELFREAGDPAGEAQALNGLGEAHLALRQPGLARGEHETALELASRIGDRDARDRASHGLGRTAGDPVQARRHQRQAITLPSPRRPGGRRRSPRPVATRARPPCSGVHVQHVIEPGESSIRSTCGAVAITLRSAPTAATFLWAVASAVIPAESQNIVLLMSATTIAAPSCSARAMSCSRTLLALLVSTSEGNSTTARFPVHSTGQRCTDTYHLPHAGQGLGRAPRRLRPPCYRRARSVS